MQSGQKNKQTELMDIQVDETLYRQAQQIASWYGLTIDQAIYYCFRAILALPESEQIAYLTELLAEYRASQDGRFWGGSMRGTIEPADGLPYIKLWKAVCPDWADRS